MTNLQCVRQIFEEKTRSIVFLIIFVLYYNVLYYKSSHFLSKSTLKCRL